MGGYCLWPLTPLLETPCCPSLHPCNRDRKPALSCLLGLLGDESDNGWGKSEKLKEAPYPSRLMQGLGFSIEPSTCKRGWFPADARILFPTDLLGKDSVQAATLSSAAGSMPVTAYFGWSPICRDGAWLPSLGCSLKERGSGSWSSVLPNGDS